MDASQYRRTAVVIALIASAIAIVPAGVIGSARSAGALATHNLRVALVLMHLPASADEPITPASAQSSMFGATSSVAYWYAQASDGQVTITGSVFGYYNSTLAPNDCDPDHWLAAATAAATQAGYNSTNFDRLLVYKPKQPGAPNCDYAGITNPVGSNHVVLNGDLSIGTVAHELGHTFGLHHSGMFVCNGASFSTSCTVNVENDGDAYDVMGRSGAWHQFSAWHKYELGWLPATAVEDVTSGARTVSLTGSGHPLASGAIEMIRIPRGDGSSYVVERRAAAPYDTGLSGVWLRVTLPVVENTNDVALVDMSANGGGADGHLAAGQTFFDPAANITISTVSDSGPTASVKVCVGPCSGSPPPTTVATTTTTTVVPPMPPPLPLGQPSWHTAWPMKTTSAGAPTVVARGVGYEVFVRSPIDNSLWRDTYGMSGWLGWKPLGGRALATNPTAVAWNAGRVDAFATDTAGRPLHWSWTYTTGWQGPETLSGFLNAPLATASYSPNELMIFGRGLENRLWAREYRDGVWGSWTAPMPNVTNLSAARPAAVSWGPNRIDVFVTDALQVPYHVRFSAGAWSSEPMPSRIVGAMSAISWHRDHLDVFGLGSDSRVHHDALTRFGGWTAWQTLPGQTVTSTPSAVSYASNHTDVFARGPSGSLLHWKYALGVWSFDDLGDRIAGTPAVGSSTFQRLDVFDIDAANNVYDRWYG